MDGLILAGGKSSRMGGKHKGFLKCKDKTFMDRLIEELGSVAEHLWISYGTEIHAEYSMGTIITDIYPGCGPISGIHEGLKSCMSRELMVAACDMPYLKGELFSYLSEKLLESTEDVEGVVPVVAGKIHPLAAIYKKRTLPVFEEQIKEGNYRLRDALGKMNILYVDMTGEEKWENMLRNVNTPEEYKGIEIC